MSDAPRRSANSDASASSGGSASILLVGFGNPGRLDDGLGPRAAEALEALQLDGCTIDSDYQLTVEDSEQASRHEVVIFVDAATVGPEPFGVYRVPPRSATSFSSHSVDPAAVVGLAGDLFGRAPTAYLVGIRGYEFNEFGERLSERASSNLEAATAYLADVLRKGDLGSLEARAQPLPLPQGGAQP